MGTFVDRSGNHQIRRISEISSTTDVPGEFMDLGSVESMFSTPVMRRAMRVSRASRAEVMKDIRARAMMRSHLAEMGRTDERYLSPEWICVSNDILSHSKEGSTAESVLWELQDRTKRGANP